MLTEHQKEKSEELRDLLIRNRIVVLEGKAGVGKTYVAAQFIKNLRGDVICSAPTNNAVLVLKSKIADKGFAKVAFQTTHSAMRMKRFIDRKGKVSFAPSFHPKYPPLKDVDYLIVDEASMVDLTMLDSIETYSDMHNCKVIFIGDNGQLPPVGYENSPVFERNYPTVSLTEIVRQKGGNPIIDLSRDLSLISKRETIVTENGSCIFSNDYSKVVDTLAHVNGTDDLKYISYKNDQIDSINSAVRLKLYGKPRRFEVGETLIFNSPFGEDFFTNSKILVNEVLVREETFNFNSHVDPESKIMVEDKVDLKIYSINPEEELAPNFVEETSWGVSGFTKKEKTRVIAIHEDHINRLNNVLKHLKTNASKGILPWPEFYSFAERFADLGYNHAITIHKSQGCTFKDTIFDVRGSDLPFLSENMKQRTFYTAVTRASNNLILYNT